MGLYYNPPPPQIGAAQPLEPRKLTPPSGPAPQNPPFMGGSRVAQAILIAWAVPVAAVILPQLLIPISGPAAAAQVAPTRVPDAVYQAWQGAAAVNPAARRLTPPISGPLADNPPIVGGARASAAVLEWWRPAAPAPQQSGAFVPAPAAAPAAFVPPSKAWLAAIHQSWIGTTPIPLPRRLLTPPISGATPSNPPFNGGARIAQGVLQWWLPPSPRPVLPPLLVQGSRPSLTDLLASNSLDLRLLCHMEPYDPNASAVIDLYYSTHGFKSEPPDTPSNQFYDERMHPQFGWKRSLFSQGRFSGHSIPGFADLGLNNNDGALDALGTYAFGARRARIYAGSKDWVLADYVLIFDGTMSNVSFSDTDVTVHLRDLQYTLDKEIQTRVFAGSGGVEGGSDVLNKLKPLPHGPCANVTPVYLGADTGYHKFAVGDGRAIVGVLCVRDFGVKLTYTASATPAAGEWTVDLSTGVITLAAFDGPVTCDVIGRRYLSTTSATSWSVAIGSKAFTVASTTGLAVGQTLRVARTSALGSTWGDGPITAIAGNSVTINITAISGAAGPFTDWTLAPWGTVAGIVKAIASDLGITTLDDAAFVSLDAAQPATAYKWIAEGGNGLQLLDEFVNGAGAFYGFDPVTRAFQVGRVTAPAGPVATYTDSEILLDSFHRVDTQEPSWQVVQRYRKNHTVLTANQIAADTTIVPDAERSFLLAEWRWETAQDSAVQTAYPLSQPIQIDGVLYDQAPSATEASRLLVLYGTRRDYFSFETKMQPLARDVNDVVNVKRDVSARFGLIGGRNTVILDIDVDLGARKTTLGVYG